MGASTLLPYLYPPLNGIGDNVVIYAHDTVGPVYAPIVTGTVIVTPEPGVWSMIGAGLGLLVLLQFRRRRNSC